MEKRLRAAETAARQAGQDPRWAFNRDVEAWRTSGENPEIVAAVDGDTDDVVVVLPSWNAAEYVCILLQGPDVWL